MGVARIPSVEGGIQPTLLDAKADLITATANDTPARLAVGSNNQVLTADSSTATGLKWATPAAGGKVLQVVNTTTNTVVTSATGTFVDTTLTATITPSSATSKVLVFVSQSGLSKSDSNLNAYGAIRLQRGATELLFFESQFAYTLTAIENNVGSGTVTYLDSPNTTSATTYKTQVRNPAGAGLVRTQTANAVSTITLIEIGA